MKTVLTAAAGLLAALGLAACDPDNGEIDATADTPAENAGEQVGETIEDMGDAMAEGAENTGEAMNAAGDEVEDAVTPDP